MLAIPLFLGAAGSGYPQRATPQSLESAELHVLPVQGNVSMMVGPGGNITIQAGKDGVLLVDTMVADWYGLPLEATRGGAKTMYPEFRQQMGPPHSPPKQHCERFCTCTTLFDCQLRDSSPRTKRP